MVRVNVGIKPYDLTDEHLRAENVEIMMLLKFVEKYPQGHVPETFSLNKGHISFFRDKVTYLFSRLTQVQREMYNRGMVINKPISELSYNIPLSNYNNYYPSKIDKKIISERLISRVINPLKKKNPFRWYGGHIDIYQYVGIYKKYYEVRE